MNTLMENYEEKYIKKIYFMFCSVGKILIKELESIINVKKIFHLELENSYRWFSNSLKSLI